VCALQMIYSYNVFLQKYEPVVHSGENYSPIHFITPSLPAHYTMVTGVVCLQVKMYPQSMATTAQVPYGHLRGDAHLEFISFQTDFQGQDLTIGMDVAVMEDEFTPLKVASKKDDRHGDEVNQVGQNDNDLKVDDAERL
jgi:hypothetical protein